jgi:RHS repeat-associated protein
LAGQYFDGESSLHYNWHRTYSPAIGRYLTPDPIGLIGGVNLISFVRNNPINAIDPLGLIDFPDILRKVIGDSAGDIFTVGFSFGTQSLIGAGFSFDRVVMPDGTPDWFVTVGAGISLPAPSLSIDRGKIWNTTDEDGRNISKDLIKGASLSTDIALGIVGFEVAPANFQDPHGDELVTLKGGLRTGVSMNALLNWTFDIPSI